MRYIIDRFEGDYAVCECDNNNMIDIKRDLLSDHACEGDVIENINGKYIINKSETQAQKNKNISLLEKLRAKNKK